MDLLNRDLRFAWRRLAARPLGSLVMIVTLGLGFGVTAAFVSSYRSMVLAPLPFDRPERLVDVTQTEPLLGRYGGGVSPGDFVEWRSSPQLAGLEAFSRASFTVRRADSVDRVSGARVTPALFRLLGVEPALGRDFVDDEGVLGAVPVAIVSEALWRRRLGAAPAAVGSMLEIDGQVHQVVGIMPSPFAFPLNEELWIPLAIDPAAAPRDRRFLQVIGRLADPATLDQARSDLAQIAARAAELYPETNRGRGVAVTPLHDALMPPVTAVAALAMVVLAGLVLLIVSVNVANVLLAESVARSREVALRAALGASRARLLREGAALGISVSVPAALLGIILAELYQGVLGSVSAVQIPYWLELDEPLIGPVYLVVLLLSGLAGAAIAWLGSRPRLVGGALAGAGADRVVASRPAARLRRAMVVAQYTMAVVVVSGALLMLESYEALSRRDNGFAVGNILTLRLGIDPALATDAPDGLALVDRVLVDLEGLSEVDAVAAASHLPVSRQGYRLTRLGVEGLDLPEEERPVATLQAVSPSYFAVLGIELLDGRLFSRADAGESRPVVVSRALAARLFGSGSVIGQRLRIDGGLEPHTVLGVVEDIVPGEPIAGVDRQPGAQLYLPLTTAALDAWPLLARAPTLLIRSGAPQEELAETLRQRLTRSTGAAVFDVLPMRRVLKEFYFAQHIWSRMFATMAAVALAIAAVGAYGVAAYSVSTRMREMGIRKALGAPRRRILSKVLGESLGLAALGLGIGVALALPGSRAMSLLLHGVGLGDPGVGPIVAAALLTVGCVAGVAPARRAASVDPMSALRTD